MNATLQQGKISDDKDVGITDQLGYVGVANSGFGMGSTITVDFEGKNLPGIGIYLGNSPEGYVVGGATASGTGFYIGNGNVSGEMSSIGRRLIVNGPNRLDPGGKYRGNDGYPPYYGRIDKLSYFGSAASGTPGYNVSAEMGYDLLEDGKKYRFELTDVSAKFDATNFNVFALNYKLYDTSGDAPVLLADVTKSVDRDFDVIDFNSQTVAFFGSIHSNLRFTYSVSGERIPYPFEVQVDPDAITLAPAKITETKKDGKWTFGGTYDYKGLGAYNVGDVLTFRFKGKNIPNVGLFVDKNGVNAIGGGTENTGLFVQTSGHGSAAYNKRLIIAGPYLVDAGGAEYYPGEAGYPAYREWVSANYEMGADLSYEVGGRFSLFGIDFLDDNTDYVYRISSAKTASAETVTLNFTLNSVSGGTETQVTSYSKTVTHLLPSLENRYAVAYGAGDYYSTNSNEYTGKPITFSYEVKKAA